MTKEEKQLLLKDLCARLTHRINILTKDNDKGHIIGVDDIENGVFEIHIIEDGDSYTCDESIENFKPYLRPMSSITEEEHKTIDNISNKGKGFEEDENGWIRCDSIHTKWGVWPDGCAKLLDYLNSIHVDYRGLIPMGIALEAPEGMYKTE